MKTGTYQNRYSWTFARLESKLMRTSKQILCVFLIGMSMILCVKSLACPPPPCTSCWTNWPNCDTWKCTGCESCVSGSCVNCGGDPTKSCCDGISCYDPETDHCCYYGTGKTCANNESCCEGTQGEDCCNNITESCCDGECFEFDDYMCCGGEVCRRPCCDDWECTKCVDGSCVDCLEKPDTYQELTQCSGTIVDDPDVEPEVNGCSIPYFLCYLFQVDCENPAGCEHTSFTNACAAHDTCYQTCGNNKSTCDSTFSGSMFQVCNGLTGQERIDCYDNCIEWRSKYVYGVVTHGESAWEVDQVEACACCKCE